MTHITASAKLMFLIAWLIFFAVLVFIFGQWESQEENPNANISTQTTANGTKILVLRQNRQHHYIVTGKINGVQVVFIVDTGASDVVVPQSLAAKLKLLRGYPMQARTASDVITVFSTIIDDLQLGDIILKNVSASINPHMPGDQVLLGMSALKKFEITQKDDQLIIKSQP